MSDERNQPEPVNGNPGSFEELPLNLDELKLPNFMEDPWKEVEGWINEQDFFNPESREGLLRAIKSLREEKQSSDGAQE